MGKKRTLWQIVLVLALSMSTAGCWDRVEIEERGFVIGVAFDKPKSPKIEQRERAEAPTKPKGPLRFVLTQQFVIPARLKSSSGGGGGGGKGESGGGGGGGGKSAAFVNVSSEGDTVFGIIREIASRVSRAPYYEHIQDIIISEDIARTGQVANLLDFFVRENEVRRGTKVLVAKGEAKRVLSVQPEQENLPAMYINSVFRNSRKNARIISGDLARLGDIHEHLLKRESFVVPEIGGTEREVKMSGAAVFDGKTHKMVGFLGEEETEGLNLLTGQVQGGVLEIPVGQNIAVLEMRKVKRQIKVDVSNPNHLIFTIQVDVYGKLGETFSNLDPTQNGVFQVMEQSSEQQVKRFGQKTIQRVQQDLQKDVLGLGTDLRLHHYSLWKQLQPNWDQGKNYFSKSEIRLKAHVVIDNAGAVNRSETSSTD